MAARFPLQPLLEHSRHRMDAAERLLRLLKKREGDAQGRLEELEGFRKEYQDRLAGTSGGGMNIQLLRDYHAFLAKIEQAVRHQQAEVEQASQRWQTAHQQWLEQRRKVKAYETLAARHAADLAKGAERRDQRATDEHAVKRFLYSRDDE